jgi:hypothetical protein
MAAINLRRVGLAGLAVGLFLNVTESVFNMAIVAREQAEAMKALHLPEITGGAIGYYVAWGFVQGLLTVWLYAAIRPRLGPGPRTAVAAGLVVWGLAYAFPALGNGVTGLAPWPLTLKILGWSLVEAPAAAVFGAWLYREA